MIRRLAGLIVGLTLLGGCASALHAPRSVDALIATTGPPGGVGPAELLVQAEAAFAERSLPAARHAVELWLAATSDADHRVAGALGAARAGLWLAGRSADPAERERTSAGAVRAAQLCLRTAPDDVRCGYWLALALGVQARERQATALDALPRIVQLLEGVIAREPGLEHAGPHRALALLYLRAPAWPVGPGDPDVGLAHARQAVELDPEYPPNQMSLAEALQAAEDKNGSAEAYLRAARLARQWLERGDPDAGDWLERSEARSGLR